MTKQEVLNYLDNVLHPIVSPDNWNVYSELHDMIEELPPVEPVRHGKWIFESIRGHAVMTCSECCKVQDGQTLCFTYCPNCGARMDKE